MEQCAGVKEFAEAANSLFEYEIYKFLKRWTRYHPDKTLLRFNRPLDEYLAQDALIDFFLHSKKPLLKLLNTRAIANHLGRAADVVYFDPITSDPLLAPTYITWPGAWKAN